MDSPSSTEESTEGTSSPMCEICELQGHGNHFGVITCRACAAFFRRMTVGTGERQKCLYQKKCEPKKGRWFCKKCRLDKCHRLGMTPHNIQHNRDLFQSSQEFLEKRRKVSIQQENIPLSMEKFAGIPQSAIHFSREKTSRKDWIYVDVSELVRKTESILRAKPKYHPEMAECSTLEKFTFGFEEVRKNQRKTDLEKIGILDERATCGFWEHLILKTASCFMYFDEFRELPFPQKSAIVKCMWNIWGRLERLSMTAEMRVNGQCGKRQFVINEDSCLDYDTTNISEKPWNSRYNFEELKCFIDTPSYYSEPLIDSFIEFCPSDVEIVFLLSHVSLELTAKKLGGEIAEVVEKLQDVLSNSLHEYYIKKGDSPRYAHRLKKLLKLGEDWVKLMNKRREKFVLAYMFDAFNVRFSHPELFEYSI